MKRADLAFLLAVAMDAVGFALLLFLVVTEAYIRWTLNQNFSFLGGDTLAALCISVFFLTAVLVYTSARER